MKHNLKTILTVMAVIIMLTINVNAKEDFNSQLKNSRIELSQDSISFLESVGIDINELYNRMDEINYNFKGEKKQINYVGDLDSDIKALINAKLAYDFTDDQVKEYVKGLLDTKSEVDFSSTLSLRSIDRPYNDDGVGYEVQSNSGYSQATSYATLPRRVINNLDDIVYLFYSVSPNTSDTPIFDFGVRGGMYHWAGTINPNPKGNEDQSIGKLDGERIYFNISIDKNNWVKCRVVSANDFSEVLYDKYYYLNGITKYNGTFNKQISLCNKYRNFNTGSCIYNGGFSKSYLYKANGSYTPMNSNSVTSRTGVFGVKGISGSRNKVHVNSYTKWTNEDVSIIFN